jgi:predicted glutamine amidotransferase
MAGAGKGIVLMCRLLAYVTRQPRTLTDVFGEGLPAFAALSAHHRDGWGFAWYRPEDGRLEVAKAPEQAQDSPAFAQAATQIRTDMLIGHLRWATPGMDLCSENTHPFARGSVAFAHNGSLAPLEAIEELIAPAERASLEGTTDSERYFLALLTAIERTGDAEQALRDLIAALHRRARSTCLNALLLTPQALYVVCDWAADAPMVRQDADYYRIYYHTSPEGVLVGSSGWQQGGDWTELKDGHALVVERGTLHTHVVELDRREEAATEETWQGQGQGLPQQ